MLLFAHTCDDNRSTLPPHSAGAIQTATHHKLNPALTLCVEHPSQAINPARGGCRRFGHLGQGAIQGISHSAQGVGNHVGGVGASPVGHGTQVGCIGLHHDVVHADHGQGLADSLVALVGDRPRKTQIPAVLSGHLGHLRIT